MESAFQFTNPSLMKIEFKMNEEFDSTDENIKMKVKVETHISREDNATEAYVAIAVQVGEETEEFPFYVYAEEAAKFRWEAGTYTEDGINKLLNQNAPALLLSYVRPVIASVTGASPCNAYNIPFMNFAGK